MLGAGVFGAGVLGAQQSQPVAGGIVIVAPADGAALGTGFVVSGTTDSAGDVEYQIDAGGWLTLATPVAGDYSGTVSGLSIGAHTLALRQSDNTGVTDSISITVVADTITITSPSQFKLYRRGPSATADVTLTVEYNGLPTNVEARLNRTGAEAWQAFARTGSPQNITLSAESRGFGTLEVRYSNATSVTDSVDDVAVGRSIAVWGQSNGSGRGTNNQTAPAAGAYLYDGTGAFRALEDPTDGTFGGSADYSALDDTASAAGSWLPRLAVRMLAQGEPVLMVNCCKGGTAIGAWARSLLTTSLYGAAKARCDSAGGVDYVIWHQGEADALAAVSEATYEANLTQLVADIRSDLSNPTVVINKIHHWTGATSTDVDAIRAAQNTVGTTVAGAVVGGDADGVTTALHLTADTDLTTMGNRVFEAVWTSTGTAELLAQSASIAGVASRVISGSGDLVAQLAVISGAGSSANEATGAGTLLSQSSSVAGTAARVVVGAGTLLSQPAAVAGAAQRSVIGSGAVNAQSATTAGTGSINGEAAGAGVLAAQASTVSGAGTRTVTGSGAVAAQSATVAGTSLRTVSASGALSAGAASVSGSAGVDGEITASGTLNAQSSAVAGTAKRTVTGAGALVAQSSIIVGSAPSAGSGTGLTEADIAAIAEAVWAHPKALTYLRFAGVK